MALQENTRAPGARHIAWARHEPRADGGTLDNLTHGLVGAAIGKGGAERATPLATATLVLAANAPDVDVFSYTQGEYFALSFRRGITHGWPALIVLPFVVTGAMLLWDRWVRRRREPSAEPARPRALLALSAVGLLTHPTLDWMNTYGMRWGLPLDGTWSYGDSLFIIDPWIWLVLGGAAYLCSAPQGWGRAGWVLLVALTSLVVLSFPLGTPAKAIWIGGLVTVAALRLRHGSRGPRFAQGALAVACLYVVAMMTSDHMSRGLVRQAAETSGLQVRDIMVGPAPANPFAAEVEVTTDTGFVPGTFDWFRDPRVELYPLEEVPLLAGPPGVAHSDLERIAARARLEPDVARYLVWSRYPYVSIEAEGTSWWVQVSDARYDGRAGSGGLSGLRVRIQD